MAPNAGFTLRQVDLCRLPKRAHAFERHLNVVHLGGDTLKRKQRYRLLMQLVERSPAIFGGRLHDGRRDLADGPGALQTLQ